MSDSDTTSTARVYDVIIVGGGPAGMFSAYYLCEHSDLRVLLIEMGKDPLKHGLTDVPQFFPISLISIDGFDRFDNSPSFAPIQGVKELPQDDDIIERYLPTQFLNDQDVEMPLEKRTQLHTHCIKSSSQLKAQALVGTLRGPRRLHRSTSFSPSLK